MGKIYIASCMYYLFSINIVNLLVHVFIHSYNPFK